MDIGKRLQELRLAKGLSQGHIEKRTGLLRCYISRLENGHTIPSIETLEKLARALDMELYQLFYTGRPNVRRKVPQVLPSPEGQKLLKVFSRLPETDRKLLLHTAYKMAAARRKG